MAPFKPRVGLVSLVLAQVHALRPFESGKVELLGAEACWAKRQFEKEAFEDLRFEHLACLASRDKACSRAATPLTTLALASPGQKKRRGDKSSTGPTEAQCSVVDDARGPLADRKTGLCTWRALSTNPRGKWVTKEEAAALLGPDPFTSYHANAGLHERKTFCREKLWYQCPTWAHTREWVPEIVAQRKCAMTQMTPPMLYNLTGRPLRVLLHGSSFFKATYRSFLCRMDEWVRWEDHHAFTEKGSSGAEAWIAQIGDALTLQMNYRDGDFNLTSSIIAGTRFHEQDEFDLIMTNFGGGGFSVTTYAQVAAERGYSGPVVFAGNPCARCCARCSADGPERDAELQRCSTGSARQMACARRAALIPISFCEMTLPYGGYRSTWAPGGQIRHAGEPHLCSPGPDDQLANMLMHVLASYFRK